MKGPVPTHDGISEAFQGKASDASRQMARHRTLGLSAASNVCARRGPADYAAHGPRQTPRVLGGSVERSAAVSARGRVGERNAR